MNITEYAITSGRDIKKAFDVLTDNNFHTDTSILNCYLALGIIPANEFEHQVIWTALDDLKALDRKANIQGGLTIQDIEYRAAIDKVIEQQVNAYYKRQAEDDLKRITAGD